MSAAGVGISWPSKHTTAAAQGNFKSHTRGNQIPKFVHKYRAQCSLGLPSTFPSCNHELSSFFSILSTDPLISGHGISKISHSRLIERLVLIDLDPATAKLAIGFLGPFFSAFGFLFILRIVMSWYPKLPVDKFPYFIAYAPTEPLLVQTRKLIPPLGGVDVTPVVWFGLISFLNEILVGPQGLLVLLSQQQV